MRRLRHVLLLVQSALAGMVAAETLLLGLVGHSPAAVALAMVTGGLALLPAAVAAGLAAGWGWARGLGIVYEVLLLVSGAFDAIVLGNEDIAALLTGVLLPLAIVWTLLVQSPGAPERSGTG